MLDQFLQSNANIREDEYGGNIENRSRFSLEVVKAVTEAIGQERVGIRFSPFNPFQGMRSTSSDSPRSAFSITPTPFP